MERLRCLVQGRHFDSYSKLEKTLEKNDFHIIYENGNFVTVIDKQNYDNELIVYFTEWSTDSIAVAAVEEY